MPYSLSKINEFSRKNFFTENDIITVLTAIEVLYGTQRF